MSEFAGVDAKVRLKEVTADATAKDLDERRVDKDWMVLI
jgi:hypothetical protein